MTDYPQDLPAEGGQQPYSGQPSPSQPGQPSQPSQPSPREPYSGQFASEQPYYGQPTPPPTAPQAPTYGQQAYGQAPVSPSDARMWAMLANLSGFLFYPIGPLVIYLIYKDRDPFIRRHAAQALNFQIMYLIGLFISAILTLILIGVVTGFAVFICWIVFPILAAIAANKGEEYDYPFIPQMVT